MANLDDFIWRVTAAAYQLKCMPLDPDDAWLCMCGVTGWAVEEKYDLWLDQNYELIEDGKITEYC